MTTSATPEGLHVALAGDPRSTFRAWARDHAALVALGLVLLVISGFTATQSEVFLTLGNLRNILLQVSVLAIVASAMTLLMVSGGIDLSVGAMMSLAAIVAALLMEQGIPCRSR